MFDPNQHEIHPQTGFIVDKDTGHRVGLDAAPVPASPPGLEWPRMVVVHDSHVVRTKVEGQPDIIAVPGWPDYHVNRTDGAVMVIANNEEEAQRAAAAAAEVNPEDVSPSTPADVAGKKKR